MTPLLSYYKPKQAVILDLKEEYGHWEKYLLVTRISHVVQVDELIDLVITNKDYGKGYEVCEYIFSKLTYRDEEVVDHHRVILLTQLLTETLETYLAWVLDDEPVNWTVERWMDKWTLVLTHI